MKLIQNRVALLAFLLVALTGSFLLLTPKPAAAIGGGCPAGLFPSYIIIYYTDASHTTVSCSSSPCTGISCDPTPYSKRINVCCAM